MSPGSSTESYPAFAGIGLRENPGKNLNQVTCLDRDSNPGHLVSQPDALTVTPQMYGRKDKRKAQKESFPKLLNDVYGNVCDTTNGNVTENLIVSFKKCGIFAFNPDAVIEHLPGAPSEDLDATSPVVDDDDCMDVGHEDDNREHSATGRKTSSNAVGGGDSSTGFGMLTVNRGPETLERGTFVIVNVSTAPKDKYWQYIAQIVNIPASHNCYDVQYLRRQDNKFVWPQVQDKDTINAAHIQLVLNGLNVLKRGFRFKSNELEGYVLH
ncbi:hypothetical protein ANN_03401 [Periplaneta americana]|uniref:Uncharacterized protein n=1 Tax=Periplaneta americana TaxID=6978 RepID=A0ABQ8U4D1_PERAM|nr:hypothetical protein ANN_03401 [Periplaneta americana]